MVKHELVLGVNNIQFCIYSVLHVVLVLQATLPSRGNHEVDSAASTSQMEFAIGYP